MFLFSALLKLSKLRASKFISVIVFQHLEFRKRLKVDLILEDWKPPEVKSSSLIHKSTRDI